MRNCITRRDKIQNVDPKDLHVIATEHGIFEEMENAALPVHDFDKDFNWHGSLLVYLLLFRSIVAAMRESLISPDPI